MTTRDFHFYEPAAGHRLPHSPFNAIIAPRPIGWISSQDSQGRLNLAPYSFFNAFNYIPPIIGFASNGLKDSLANIEATGEFCWNLVSRELGGAMNTSSAQVDPEVDEFTLSGVTPNDSQIVKTPHVAEARVVFECRLTQILQLQTVSGELTQTRAIFGEVVGVHIDHSLLKDGIYQTAAADPLLRGGGPSRYFTIREEDRIDMYRPDAQ